MNPEILIPLIVDLVLRLLPVAEKIIEGTEVIEDIDWNDYLKHDDFLERLNDIRDAR